VRLTSPHHFSYLGKYDRTEVVARSLRRSCRRNKFDTKRTDERVHGPGNTCVGSLAKYLKKNFTCKRFFTLSDWITLVAANVNFHVENNYMTDGFALAVGPTAALPIGKWLSVSPGESLLLKLSWQDTFDV
jgi:hypothetical protein